MVLEAVKRTDPILVGFSLIFQFYIRRYGALIRMLREEGVGCHFTMGGHYPEPELRADVEGRARVGQRSPVRGRDHSLGDGRGPLRRPGLACCPRYRVAP